MPSARAPVSSRSAQLRLPRRAKSPGARATGAARGAVSKDLEIIEFADLQCPHCKEVQSTLDDIVRDFPKARVVFQLYPLVEIHSSAFKAAAYGVCAQKISDDAFFKYLPAYSTLRKA